MAGKEKMRASEYKKNRTKIEPGSKEYEEIRGMKRENLRELSDAAYKRAMNVPGSLKDAGKRILSAIAPVAEKAMGARDIGMEGMEGMGRLPMNPMVPGQMGRIPGMRRGGSVKKYSEGGESEEKKEAPKEDKAPKKKGGLFGGYGTRQEQLDAMGLRGGGKVMKKMYKGGDLYTTPGGPARGKSGKIKKMARGGMSVRPAKPGASAAPAARKTAGRGTMTPNPSKPVRSIRAYAGGGSIDGCAVKGKTRAKRVRQ